MALSQKKLTDVPSDAVILTETEAYEYQTRIINGWTETSEVYVIRKIE